MSELDQINLKRSPKSRLIAISFESVRVHGKLIRKVWCKCICGKMTLLPIRSVTTNNTKSCGCLRREFPNGKKYTHSIPKLRTCYQDMMNRCYKEECKNFPLYGIRGVIVCEEWKNSYQSFLNWSLANGWKPGLQLDKDIIPNKLGIPALLYSPEMCCFVTPKENAGTRSTTRLFNYKGKSLRMSELCELEGINKRTFEYFLYRKKKTVSQSVKLAKQAERGIKTIRSDNTSGLNGVTYKGQCNKWMAQINHKGRHYYIGIYKTKKEAAIAYNKKAIELYGELANLNVIK